MDLAKIPEKAGVSTSTLVLGGALLGNLYFGFSFHSRLKAAEERIIKLEGTIQAMQEGERTLDERIKSQSEDILVTCRRGKDNDERLAKLVNFLKGSKHLTDDQANVVSPGAGEVVISPGSVGGLSKFARRR